MESSGSVRRGVSHAHGADGETPHDRQWPTPSRPLPGYTGSSRATALRSRASTQRRMCRAWRRPRGQQAANTDRAEDRSARAQLRPGRSSPRCSSGAAGSTRRCSRCLGLHGVMVDARTEVRVWAMLTVPSRHHPGVGLPVCAADEVPVRTSHGHTTRSPQRRTSQGTRMSRFTGYHRSTTGGSATATRPSNSQMIRPTICGSRLMTAATSRHPLATEIVHTAGAAAAGCAAATPSNAREHLRNQYSRRTKAQPGEGSRDSHDQRSNPAEHVRTSMVRPSPGTDSHVSANNTATPTHNPSPHLVPMSPLNNISSPNPLDRLMNEAKALRVPSLNRPDGQVVLGGCTECRPSFFGAWNSHWMGGGTPLQVFDDRERCPSLHSRFLQGTPVCLGESLP